MLKALKRSMASEFSRDRHCEWFRPRIAFLPCLFSQRLVDLLEQIAAFPNTAHDDMADMMTQASAWLLRANWPTVTVSTVYL
jgi:hypothetical protein